MSNEANNNANNTINDLIDWLCSQLENQFKENYSKVDDNKLPIIMKGIHPLDEVERLYRESFQSFFAKPKDNSSSSTDVGGDRKKELKLHSVFTVENDPIDNKKRKIQTNVNWINNNLLNKSKEYDIIRNDIHTCIEYDPTYPHFQMMDKDDYYSFTNIQSEEVYSKLPPEPGTCFDLNEKSDWDKFFYKGQFDHNTFLEANKFYGLVSMGNLEKVFETSVDEFEAVREAQHNINYFQPLASTLVRMFAKLSNIRMSYLVYGNRELIVDKQTAWLALDVLYNMCSLATDANYLKTSDELRTYKDQEGRSRGFGNPYDHKWLADCWGVDTQAYLNELRRGVIAPGHFLLSLLSQLVRLRKGTVGETINNWQKEEYNLNPLIQQNIDNYRIVDVHNADSVDWMPADATNPYPTNKQFTDEKQAIINLGAVKDISVVKNRERYSFSDTKGVWSIDPKLVDELNKKSPNARFADPSTYTPSTGISHQQGPHDITTNFFTGSSTAFVLNCFWNPWFARSTSNHDNFNGDLTHIEMRWNRGMKDSKINIHWVDEETKKSSDEYKAALLDKAAYTLSLAFDYCVRKGMFSLFDAKTGVKKDLFDIDGKFNTDIFLGEAEIAVLIEDLFEAVYGFLGVKFAGIDHTPIKVNLDYGFRFLNDHSITKLNQHVENGEKCKSYSNYIDYLNKVESYTKSSSNVLTPNEKAYLKSVINLLKKGDDQERPTKNYQHVSIKRNDWDEFEFVFMPPDDYSLCPFDGISFVQSLNLPVVNNSDKTTGMNVSYNKGKLKFNGISQESEGNPNLDAIYLYNVYEKDNVYKYYDTSKVYKLVVEADEVPTYYHVVFKDSAEFGNSVLYERVVLEGDSATPPSNPVKSEPKDGYFYDFTGWDKSLDNITEDLTVTAVYNKVKGRVVKLIDSFDGSVCSEQVVYPGGSVSEPTVDSNVKIYNDVEEWYFDGWDKPLDNITSDQTITTVYRKVKYYCFDPEFLKNYTPVSDVKVKSSATTVGSFKFSNVFCGSKTMFKSEMRIIYKDDTFVFGMLTSGSYGYVRPVFGGVTYNGKKCFHWGLAENYGEFFPDNEVSEDYHLFEVSFKSNNQYLKVDEDELKYDGRQGPKTLPFEINYGSSEDAFALFNGYYFNERRSSGAAPNTSIKCFKYFLHNETTNVDELKYNLIPVLSKDESNIGFYNILDNTVTKLSLSGSSAFDYTSKIEKLSDLSACQKEFWEIKVENGPID